MSEGKRNIIYGGGAVLLLALAVVLFAWRGGSGANLPAELTARCVCLETHQEFTLKYGVRDAPPLVNPNTGRRTVYPWWYCPECNKRFIPDLVPDPRGGPPKPPPIPSCPLCGSNRVGTWDPAIPEQANPDGDAPLPELPQ